MTKRAQILSGKKNPILVASLLFFSSKVINFKLVDIPLISECPYQHYVRHEREHFALMGKERDANGGIRRAASPCADESMMTCTLMPAGKRFE